MMFVDFNLITFLRYNTAQFPQSAKN